jgi:hypothetical protein
VLVVGQTTCFGISGAPGKGRVARVRRNAFFKASERPPERNAQSSSASSSLTRRNCAALNSGSQPTISKDLPGLGSMGLGSRKLALLLLSSLSLHQYAESVSSKAPKPLAAILCVPIGMRPYPLRYPYSTTSSRDMLFGFCSVLGFVGRSEIGCRNVKGDALKS